MKCPGQKRVGIELRYAIDRYLSQPVGVADRQVLALARKAVPRLRRASFDTGAGPFGGPCTSTKKRCEPKRDISIDFWGKNQCGLTSAEAVRIKKAYRGTGVEVDARALCCVRGQPWYPPKRRRVA